MKTIKSFKSLVSKFNKVVYHTPYKLEFDYENEVISIIPPVGCPVCNDVLDDVAIFRELYPNVGYYCSVLNGVLSLTIYLMFK